MEKFRFMAAPLEDVSDNAFRTICHRHGADDTFTEMTRVEGLAFKNASTWSRLDFKDETPTHVQLLAGKEASLHKFLSMFEPPKGFLGFNLNLGCPSPDVIKIGQGCAMMKRVAKVDRLMGIIRDKGYPVSLKMRLGMNKYEKDRKTYMNLLKGTDPDFFIVHARHGGQKYVEPADFSVYEECASTGKTIIANGDIKSSEQVEMLKSAGVKGVMIGRAAVRDPSIFAKLKGEPYPEIDKLREEYIDLAERFKSPERYRENVLKRLGVDTQIDKDRLI